MLRRFAPTLPNLGPLCPIAFTLFGTEKPEDFTMTPCLRVSGLTMALAMLALGPTLAAERSAKLKPGQYNPAHASVEMFQAMEQGQIEVKIIPKDSTEANVLFKNKTDKPLNVQLPEAFAALPVLAQFGGGGGQGGFGGGGQGGGGGGNQGGGGGFGGGGGQGGGQGGGGGGNFFNVAPEKVGEVKVALVCLEHGKKEPRAAIPYEIVPITKFTSDPAVHEMLKLFAQGRIDQRSAQAAAWHLASKMSWQELAAKQVIRATGRRYPWFAKEELQRALALVNAAQEQAKDRPQSSPGQQASAN